MIGHAGKSVDVKNEPKYTRAIEHVEFTSIAAVVGFANNFVEYLIGLHADSIW